MAFKLLELDLAEKLLPIPKDKNYQYYRILVRHHTKPVGWIQINCTSEDDISIEQQHEAIKKFLNWEVPQAAIANYLGIHQQNSIINNEGITVVVCTRNRTQNLASCLQALLALQYSLYEIIIVDNAPDNDDTYNLVKNFPVRYVRENRPGLDWARNRGIQEATYDIVAFTDDDALADRWWLQNIAKNFWDKEVMAVTGYVAPAEIKTPAQRIFEFGFGGMGHGFRRRTVRRAHLTDRALVWASGFGVGANMAFRRSVFNSIGLFDTALDVGTPSCGGGDIEMFHRVVAKGHMLVYDPDAIVWHNHRQHMPGLRKQIGDNGKSFGCYLISCYQNKTVKRTAVIQFFLVDWLLKWNLKNLFTSKKINKHLSLIELYGMMQSPLAYRRSKKWAKEVAQKHS